MIDRRIDLTTNWTIDRRIDLTIDWRLRVRMIERMIERQACCDEASKVRVVHDAI